MLLMFLLMVSWVFSASFLGIISLVESWILAICSLALISFIYVRPYEGVLDNAGVTAGIIQIIFFSAWGISRNHP